MRKQILIGGLVLLAILLLCPLPVNAKILLMEREDIGLDPSELDFGEVDALLEESEADEILQSQMDSPTVGELLKSVISGDFTITWRDWAAAFASSLWGNLQLYIDLMLKVTGLALLSQFFNGLTMRSGEGSSAEVGSLCIYGVVVLLLIESFQIVYEETGETVERVRDLSMYMMPAMAAVAVAGGFPISSIMQGEALTGGFSLILTVIGQFLIPGVLGLTIIEVINLIGKRAMLSQLISLGRTILEKGIKAISVLYLMVMGVIGAVTPAADRMVYKVSSTLLSSVPVVGSAISGAMDSVMAGSILIKNGIGATGCILLLCICLVPVVKLTAFWLIYRLMAAFLMPVADARVVKILGALGRSAAMLLGMLVSSMVIFTGVVGIMIVTLGR